MRWVTFSAVVLLGLSAQANALTDAEILREADIARGNLPGVQWEVDVADEGDDSAVAFAVSVRHADFLAEYLAPARQKGNRLLALGGNLWFYKPGLSKPVPISRRQRMSGNAAYGDISATNYAEDYAPERLPDADVDGEPCYVFSLTALPGRRTTYDRVKIWISKQRLVGVRAEYFTVSGKLFKSAVLAHDLAVAIEGRERAFLSSVRFKDELLGGKVTVMRLRNPQVVTIDEALFDVDALGY